MKDNPFKIGIPTILMLLFSLCLIIFSLLSLCTASSDYKLSMKIANRSSAYYEANNIAQADANKFIEASKNNIFENTYYIDENEALHVLVQKDNNDITILSWNIIYTTEDNYDEHLNVIK